MKFLFIIFSLVLTSTSFASNIKCERTECSILQPDGGPLAQSMCDLNDSLFELEITDKEKYKGNLVVTTEDGTKQSTEVSVVGDEKSGYNIGAIDSQEGLKAYLPTNQNTEGLIMYSASSGSISYALIKVQCNLVKK